MSLAIVTVTVPASGEGPAANIAALVGSKTVTLTGRFSGAYTLLASHNGSNFVPVLVFNSDGAESIRCTLPEAYNTVRVRCGANTVALGSVAMTVAGVSLPGENLFASLATFLAGASGTTSPVFDLATLFPPTGIEEGINIICEGGLVGALLVEGSQDGLAFGPMGTFQGGQSPRPLVGLPAPLEFSPLTTCDQVRYLRFTLQGQAASDVILTVGGRIPATGGGAGVPIQVFVSSALGNVFQGLGQASAAPLDLSNVVVGANTVGACPSATVVGNNNTLVTGSNNTTIIGTINSANGDLGVIIGRNNTNANVVPVHRLILIGDTNINEATTEASLVVGFNNFLKSDNPNSILIGWGNTLDSASENSVLVGAASTLSFLSPRSVIVGPTCSVSDHSDHSTLVGSTLVVGATSPNTVAVGTSITTAGTTATLVGTSLTNLGAASLLMAGVGNTVGLDSHNTTVLGRGCVVGERCGSSVLVATGLVVPDDSTNTTAVGSGGTLGAGSPYCVMLGTAPIGATSPVSICVNGVIGDNADHSCAILGTIGSPGGLSAKENFCYGNTSAILDGTTLSVLIGGGNGAGSLIASGCTGSILVGPVNAINTNSPNSVAVGSVLVTTGASSTLVGTSLTNLGAASLLMAGVGNTVGVDSNNTTVLGRGCVVGERCGSSVLVTTGLVVPDDSINTTAVGSGGTLGAGSPNCILVGAANNVGPTSPNAVVIGSSCTVGAAGSFAANVVAIGTTITVLGANSENVTNILAAGDTIHVQGQLNGVDPGANIVALGNNITLGDGLGTGSGVTNVIALGAALSVGDTARFNIVVGYSTTLSTTATHNLVMASAGGQPAITGTHNLAIGTAPHLGASSECVLLSATTAFGATSIGAGSGGSVAINGIIGNNTPYSTAVGYLAQVTSAAANSGVAIGSLALAADNECVVGTSIGGAIRAINTFVVRGLTAAAAAIDTIRCTSQPSADDLTGLFVPVRLAGTTTSKQVKAAVAPPGGSLLLYVDP